MPLRTRDGRSTLSGIILHRKKRWPQATAALLLLGVAIFCPIGCGSNRPERVAVAGTVVIDGQPLTRGQVRFVPEGARPSYGEIDDQGGFTLTCFDGKDGAVPGNHRVEVIAVEELSATEMRWLAPKKYANFETSGLTAQVDRSTSDMRLELTWDGGEPFIERFGR